MIEIFKSICLILITISIIFGIGFYCYDVYQTRKYLEKKNECIEKCFKEARKENESSEELLKSCKEICSYEFLIEAVNQSR